MWAKKWNQAFASERKSYEKIRFGHRCRKRKIQNRIFRTRHRENDDRKILKPKDFGHSIADLESLLVMIRNVQQNQIGVMMESTYVYQNPIIEFFKRKGFEEITLVNPLKIKKTCGDIQKVKTDRIDCARIASYYYFSQWSKPFEVSSEHREARELARYLDSIREEQNAIRNRIRQHLTNVFPELEKIGDEKSNIFSSGFLNILEKMPHPLSLRKKTEKGIVSLMAGKGKKASCLRILCQRNSFCGQEEPFLGSRRRNRIKGNYPKPSKKSENA